MCVFWQFVRTTPPWPTRDNGGNNFSADRAKCCSFGARHCLIRCPDKPLREQTGPVLVSGFLFQQLALSLKVFQTFKHPQTRPRLFLRNELQANYFTSTFTRFKMWVARRSERKGCLALSQTSQQGCGENWSPLMAAKCSWKKVVTTRSMPIVEVVS